MTILATLDVHLARLTTATARRRSDSYCLRLWSAFVRARDGGRCVVCDSDERLAAHHVFRKVLFTWARYETGNGITLCRECHREPHAQFNGRPDLSLPMDAQGGENIDLSIAYHGYLLDQARCRELLRDDYYFLSEQTLHALKRFQGIPIGQPFPGLRFEQAALVWRQSDRSTMRLLLGRMGHEIPVDLVQQGPLMGFYALEDGTVHPLAGDPPSAFPPVATDAVLPRPTDLGSWPYRTNRALSESFGVCRSVWTDEAGSFARGLLLDACHSASRAVIYLTESGMAWEADAHLRTVIEGTVRLLHLSTGDAAERECRQETYVDVAPDLDALDQYERAAALAEVVGQSTNEEARRAMDALLSDVPDPEGLRAQYPPEARAGMRSASIYELVAKLVAKGFYTLPLLLRSYERTREQV